LINDTVAVQITRIARRWIAAIRWWCTAIIDLELINDAITVQVTGITWRRRAAIIDLELIYDAITVQVTGIALGVSGRRKEKGEGEQKWYVS
jgi:hypothetical protein